MGITDPRFTNWSALNRFCQACDYNIEKSIKLFEAYWSMRHSKNVDGLIQQDWSGLLNVRAFYPRQFYKNDLYGRPILIEKLGRANFKELFKVGYIFTQHFTLDYLKNAMLVEYELLDRVMLPNCSKLAGIEVKAIVSIIDLKGISMTDLMSTNLFDMVKWSIKLFQEYYPELVHKCFIVNTPMLFSGFWTVVKPLFTSRTQSTIQVCSGNGAVELRSFITPEHIPQEYGGISPEVLDGVDRGVYLSEANACFNLKKWDPTPEEVANVKNGGNSHYSSHMK